MRANTSRHNVYNLEIIQTIFRFLYFYHDTFRAQNVKQIQS